MSGPLGSASEHSPLYCVDKGLTLVLAFALRSNCTHFVAAEGSRLLVNTFRAHLLPCERNSAQVGKAAQLIHVLIHVKNASAPYTPFKPCK